MHMDKMISMCEAQFIYEVESLLRRQKTTTGSGWFNTSIEIMREEGFSIRVARRFEALCGLPGLVQGRKESGALDEIMQVVDRFIDASKSKTYIEFIDDENDEYIPLPNEVY
jgi:hypothetical protein